LVIVAALCFLGETGGEMKLLLAAAVAASASICLAAAPADAAQPAPPAPIPDRATIKVVPEWTYAGNGKLAVITGCSHRGDLRVVSSRMLRRPVNMPRRGNLLIRVTKATRPGRYTIALWCVTGKGQVDAMDVKWVRIRGRLKGRKLPPPPGLPRGFRPSVTASTTGPR
jgi:hypothetical protein